MIFNSIEFLIFLPVVFVCYWFIFKKNTRLQNLFVIAASYFFYGWWDWRFLILIAFTSFCSWGSGLLIGRQLGQDNKKKAKAINTCNILLNLLILGIFKYYNFFVESFFDIFPSLQNDRLLLNVVLPVGISFYTFQALSYSIDVYRGKLEPTRDVIQFFAFVSFFPQLVAGPIERATNLLPQFAMPRKFDYDTAVDGMRQILWGLFKKMVVADNCAVYVDHVFSTYTEQSGSTLLLAAIFFTFQIYGDFSGYSDIAIGTAKLFGIRLMQNFNVPYFSRDIAEFWRRWHISLNTWFRDYVYIPLGGSRTTKAKIVRNTFVIFLLSGLWHGANWTFIAWGAYHALLFLPLIVSGKNRKYTDTVAEGKFLPSFKELCMMLLTFVLVVIGWIVFRAETIGDAGHYIASLFSPEIWKASYRFFLYPFNHAGWLVLIMLTVEWLQRGKEHGLAMTSQKIFAKWYVRWCIYLIVSLACILGFSIIGKSDFIYFQF